jgi:Protein of unknown function (DUF2931)
MKIIIHFLVVVFACICCKCSDSHSISKLNNDSMNNQEDKFEWYPSSTAPADFPFKMTNAEFTFADNQKISLPVELFGRSGWINIGSIELMNERVKPIPVGLTFNWFSFREQKFYRYDGPIPADKIAAMFKTGFTSPIDNKKRTFENIIVGVAPYGHLCLYLEGNGVCEEVDMLNGEEVHLSEQEIAKYVSIYKTLQNYVDVSFKQSNILSLRDKIDLNLYSARKYTTDYKKKYACQLTPALSKNMLSIRINNFNGERLYWYEKEIQQMPDSMTVPSEITITWSRPEDKSTCYSVVTFDENEIFSAFKKIEVFNEPIRIQPEINTMNFETEVYIISGKNAIKLEKNKYYHSN